MGFSSSPFSIRAMDCGGSQIMQTIVVDQSGKGNFPTVQAAIDSIKQNNDQWVKVHINAGKYTEKVEIPVDKPWVFLEGDGKDVTSITYGDPQKPRDWEATFTCRPPNVVVSGITFENSYNLAGPAPVKQAVAAAIYGEKSAFLKCGFVGFQDTLFDSKGKHYFKDCYIQGEVDFIFGTGQSYYENCMINATQGSLTVPGFVTAQRRDSARDPSGFVFEGGSVKGSGKVNLGRAWGPYSRVIFHGTYFDSLITPEGWDAWDFKGHEDNITYAEVDCTGPGNDTTHRVQWEKKLSPSDMNNFSLSSFVNTDGWLEKLPTCLS